MTTATTPQLCLEVIWASVCLGEGPGQNRSEFQQTTAGTLVEAALTAIEPQVAKHIPRTLLATSGFPGNGTGAKAAPSWSPWPG